VLTLWLLLTGPSLAAPPAALPSQLRDRPAVLCTDLVSRVRGAPPEAQPALQVSLGQCLLDLGLPDPAGDPFAKAISWQPDGPSAAAAWEGLAQAADAEGDDQALERALQLASLDHVPADLQDRVRWLAARVAFFRDDPETALALLDPIPADSPYAARAHYLQGLVLQQQGKLKSAINAWNAIPAGDPLHARALLAVGRTWYGIVRFPEAAKYDEQVPTDSVVYGDSRLDLAWSRFMQGDLAGADQALDQADATGTWLPELPVLRALVDYSRSACDQVPSDLAALDTQDLAALDAVVALMPVDTHDPQPLFQAWLAPGVQPPVSPPLRDLLWRDRGLSQALAHLVVLAQEDAALAHAPAALRAALSSSLAARRTELQRQADLSLRSRAEQVRSDLSSLVAQRDILLAESLDAQHEPAAGDAFRALLPHTDPAIQPELRFRIAQAHTPDPAERVAATQQLLADFPDYDRADELTLALARDQWNGDRAQAVDALQQLVQAWPDSASAVSAWLLLGDAAFEARRWDDAVAAYQHALDTGAQRAAALDGVVPLRDDSDPMADLATEQAIARYRLAWCAWAQGRHHAARVAMKAAAADASDPAVQQQAQADLAKLQRR